MITRKKYEELRERMSRYGESTVILTADELNNLLSSVDLLRECRKFLFNRLKHADLHFKGFQLLKKIRASK